MAPLFLRVVTIHSMLQLQAGDRPRMCAAMRLMISVQKAGDCQRRVTTTTMNGSVVTSMLLLLLMEPT